MKAMIFPLLLAALATSTSVAANRVTPTVTGTVSAIDMTGTQTQITIKGRTYTVAPNAKLANPGSTLKAGQAVTLMLGADGKTVIATQAAEKNAQHP